MNQVTYKKNYFRSKSGYKDDINISKPSEKINTAKGNSQSDKIKGTAKSSGIGNGTGIGVYARVSTQSQEKEETIQSQIQAVHEYIEKDSGITVQENHIFIDEGYSGSTLIRPGLDRLRDSIARREYDKVFVYDPDRLARNYLYQMLLLEEFEKNDCHLEFVRCPIGKTPDEQLLLQMQGVIAEYERAKICDRTRRGKMHRMRNGELVTGRRTFGYQYISKSGDRPAHYKIIPEEAEVIADIFKWYTTESIAIRQVAKKLNETGIPTLRGKKWQNSSIHHILKNSMYTGTGFCNKEKAVLPKDRPLDIVYRKYPKTGKKSKPRKEWLTFSCPSIIDDETFDLAQERCEHNKKLSARRTQREYLLRGLVICPDCSKRMQVEGRSMKYMCPHSRESYVKINSRPVCSNKVRFPVSELDDFIWNETVKILKKPANLKKYYRQLSSNIAPRASGNINMLDSKKEKAVKQLSRTNSLFIRGMIDETEHAAKYKDIKDIIHNIQIKINKFKDDNIEEHEIEQMLASFNKFATSVKTQIKNADFSIKRSIVEQLVKNVSLKNKSVTVSFAAPLDKCSLRTTNNR